MNDDRSAPDAAAEESETRRLLLAALARLTCRERRLLALRFGVNGPPHGLVETAAILGMTADQARDLERRALEGLREAARTVGLLDRPEPDEVVQP